MIIDLHHAEPDELRQRKRDLEARFDDLEVDEIFATSSRNEFLVQILSRPKSTKSVALIDLRTETGDIEQSGLRIARTIAANPALNARTSTAVWTEHVSNANVIFSSASGARGLISDAWVDESPEHALENAIRRIAESSPGEFFSFPPRPTLDVRVGDPDDRERAMAFERWFGFEPRDLHFHLLWGMANAVELEFLKEYLAEIEVAASKSAAKGQLERLQLAMRDEIQALDRPESGNPEMARRFLAELMTPDFDPLPELNWPRLSTVQELLLDQSEAVSYSFVDGDALRMLELFLSLRRAPEVAAARPKGSDLYQAIEDAVLEVATRLDISEAIAFNTIHLAAQSIDDAYWDLRRYGSPQKMG